MNQLCPYSMQKMEAAGYLERVPIYQLHNVTW